MFSRCEKYQFTNGWYLLAQRRINQLQTLNQVVLCL